MLHNRRANPTNDDHSRHMMYTKRSFSEKMSLKHRQNHCFDFGMLIAFVIEKKEFNSVNLLLKSFSGNHFHVCLYPREPYLS